MNTAATLDHSNNSFSDLLDGYLIVDNYAGGGGASTGFKIGIGVPVSKAINHNDEAIGLHKINHPGTDHYCESIEDVDPHEVCGDQDVASTWNSPDCTHHSTAKGGVPLDQNLRGLAWNLLRWKSAKRPPLNFLENVAAFLSWGPLGPDNKPIPERAGETFQGFVLAMTTGLSMDHPSWEEAVRTLGIEEDQEEQQKLIDGYGYQVEWQVLNAADYGAPTNRSRLLMVTRDDGNQIEWPEQTHAHRSSPEVLSGQLIPWKGAGEVFDFGLVCKSIFNRKRPLAQNTLMRIARCAKEFLLDSDEPYILEQGSGASISSEDYRGEIRSKINEFETLRMSTIDTPDSASASLAFMDSFYGRNSGVSCMFDKPTIQFASCLLKLRNANYGTSLFDPVPTITAGGLQLGEVRMKIAKSSDQNLGRQLLSTEYIRGNEIWMLIDIAMRMLSPSELFSAQSFPEDFIHDRTEENPKLPILSQARICGNSVPPELAAALIKANMKTLALQ